MARPTSFPDYDLNLVNFTQPANAQINNGRALNDQLSSSEWNWQQGTLGLWVRYFDGALTSTATAAGTTTLTVASTDVQVFTGATTQNVALPDETTLAVGRTFRILNLSTGALTVKDSGGAALFVVSGSGNGLLEFVSVSAGAATGNWQFRNKPGQLLGTTTNDAASAGFVGEVMSLLDGFSIGPATNTAVNLCDTPGPSVLLTPGDWEISAMGDFYNTTTGFHGNLSISKTSATLAGNAGHPDNNGQIVTSARSAAVNDGFSTQAEMTLVIPPYRISLAASTSYFLVARVLYTGGLMNMDGSLVARRIR